MVFRYWIRSLTCSHIGGLLLVNNWRELVGRETCLFCAYAAHTARISLHASWTYTACVHAFQVDIPQIDAPQKNAVYLSLKQ